MSLANMRDLILRAKEERRAVGAFSVSSIDMILGVVAAAEELNTPVILQVAESRLDVSPLRVLGAAMRAAAEQARVPVAVHLDHGVTFGCIRQALDCGFTSVMFDGSRLPLEENIARTREVIAMARPYGAAVEAEIGSVGKTESGEAAPAVCADPAEGIRFARETGVDALAVAIGNAHGVYVGSPNLRFEVLEEMRRGCDTPFVLHGGTGISDDDFRRAIALGMGKINIATATFIAAYQAAQESSDYFDMSRRMTAAARGVAQRHIPIFGLAGQKEA
ncbi:MAG: ketose-bisphosphate aldolase [Christensenellaceae bacterium]|nr:ketose-bisphosphate aldolase [Christensenellaceae bacterium]